MAVAVCLLCERGPLVSTRDTSVPTCQQHRGRGLCGDCYSDCARSGTLLEWPRLTRPAVELLADAELLRRRYDPPMIWTEVADRLGVQVDSLLRARSRARARERAGQLVEPNPTGRSDRPAPRRSSR